HRAHPPLRQTDPRLDHPGPSHARAGRPVDLAGPGRLRPAAPGPRARRRPAAAVGTAPTPAAAVTLPGPTRVSAATGTAGLASEYTETLRALPRPAQGPLLGTCQALPGGQEARQETPQEADHSREGRLTGPAQPPHPPTSVDDQPDMPEGVKSQAKSTH